jgi:hypothetical protein
MKKNKMGLAHAVQVTVSSNRTVPHGLPSPRAARPPLSR